MVGAGSGQGGLSGTRDRPEAQSREEQQGRFSGLTSHSTPEVDSGGQHQRPHHMGLCFRSLDPNERP